LYVAFRKNLGVSFENDAKLLQMFSRVVGETLDISSVPADRVKAFLDESRLTLAAWRPGIRAAARPGA
jgi:hypothetical protein